MNCLCHRIILRHYTSVNVQMVLLYIHKKVMIVGLDLLIFTLCISMDTRIIYMHNFNTHFTCEGQLSPESNKHYYTVSVLFRAKHESDYCATCVSKKTQQSLRFFRSIFISTIAHICTSLKYHMLMYFYLLLAKTSTYTVLQRQK